MGLEEAERLGQRWRGRGRTPAEFGMKTLTKVKEEEQGKVVVSVITIKTKRLSAQKTAATFFRTSKPQVSSFPS